MREKGWFNSWDEEKRGVFSSRVHKAGNPPPPFSRIIIISCISELINLPLLYGISSEQQCDCDCLFEKKILMFTSNCDKNDMIHGNFLGRGDCFPIAKEISHIYASFPFGIYSHTCTNKHINKHTYKTSCIPQQPRSLRFR